MSKCIEDLRFLSKKLVFKISWFQNSKVKIFIIFTDSEMKTTSLFYQIELLTRKLVIIYYLEHKNI